MDADSTVQAVTSTNASANAASTNLHGSVVEHLGALIVNGGIAEGTVVSVDRLEGRLDVSRSVIREAIRVLEAKGLVASRRRVGITVQPRQAWQVLDPSIIRWRMAGQERLRQLHSLGELRRGIEPVAAALAAARATPEHCRVMSAAVVDMTVHARSGDLNAYLQADQLFHDTLLQASGNEMLAALRGVVHEVLSGRTEHGLMPADPNPAAIRLHGDVAAAVLAGDAPTAERCMREIVEEATEALGQIGNT